MQYFLASRTFSHFLTHLMSNKERVEKLEYNAKTNR